MTIAFFDSMCIFLYIYIVVQHTNIASVLTLFYLFALPAVFNRSLCIRKHARFTITLMHI